MYLVTIRNANTGSITVETFALAIDAYTLADVRQAAGYNVTVRSI